MTVLWEKGKDMPTISMFMGKNCFPSKDWINENYQVDTAAGLEIEG